MGKNKKAGKGGRGGGKGGLLSTTIASGTEFAGLAGFEEVSSCTLIGVNKYGRVKKEVWENGKIVKKTNQKAKQAKVDQQSESVEEGDSKKEKKRKRKKKDKKAKETTADVTEENNDSQLDASTVNIEHIDDQSSNAGNAQDDHNDTKLADEKGKKRKKTKKKQGGAANKKKKYDSESYEGSGESEETAVDVSAWEAVFAPPQVLQALAELGFSQPTEIQKLVLPAAIKGRKDIIGAAETGSGKTLAFSIPIIHGILEDKRREAMYDATDSGMEHSEDDDSDSGNFNCLEEIDGDVDDIKGTTEGGVDSEDEVGEEGEEDEVEEDGDEIMEGDSDEEVQEDEETAEDDDDETSAFLTNESDSDDEGEEGEMVDEENSAEDMQGLGCVKVIHNANFDFLDEGSTKKHQIPKNKLRALIVTPTRELAIQVKSHLSAVLRHTDLKAAVVVGGVAVQKQERLLKKGPDIVVGTPGRLWELIQHSNPHLIQVPEIRYLAIDETDRMVERGHFQELVQLLELINSNEAAKQKRQTFVFSATLSTVHDTPKRLQMKHKTVKVTSEMKIENLAKLIGVKPKPKIVDVTRQFGTAASLTEGKINCLKEEKDIYLYYFLKCYPGRTLVFSNSIDCVRRLQNLFTLLQCRPQSLHASMHQKQRLKSLEEFSSNPRALLLATDVAARGLDIPNIQHVIHYQVPRTAETYIHRSGRTARATKEGLSILLVETAEIRKYRQLCGTLNRTSELPPFPVDTDILGQIKKRVSLARTVEKMEHTQRKTHAKKDWFRKAAEEAELFIEEDKYDDDEERDRAMAAAREKREMKGKRSSLMQLLASPLLSYNFSGKYPTQTGSLMMPLLPDTNTGLDGEEEKHDGKALSVMKRESVAFSKLVKKVKIKPPVKKVNKKKFKGFEKRKKKQDKEDEKFRNNDPDDSDE